MCKLGSNGKRLSILKGKKILCRSRASQVANEAGIQTRDIFSTTVPLSEETALQCAVLKGHDKLRNRKTGTRKWKQPEANPQDVE